MRLLPASRKGFGFLLNPAERHLFAKVLGQYPVVPASHHALSKSLDTGTAAEEERLLHEALAEQRAARVRPGARPPHRVVARRPVFVPLGRLSATDRLLLAIGGRLLVALGRVLVPLGRLSAADRRLLVALGLDPRAHGSAAW